MIGPYEFEGNFINCYTENEVITLGIGTDDVDPTYFIILTKLENEIGIQTSQSENETDSCIEAIQLENNELYIIIKKSKFKELGANLIKISFSNEQENLNQLIEYLHLIFDDSQIALTINLESY